LALPFAGIVSITVGGVSSLGPPPGGVIELAQLFMAIANSRIADKCNTLFSI